MQSCVSCGAGAAHWQSLSPQSISRRCQSADVHFHASPRKKLLIKAVCRVLGAPAPRRGGSGRPKVCSEGQAPLCLLLQQMRAELVSTQRAQVCGRHVEHGLASGHALVFHAEHSACVGDDDT